MRRTRPYRQAVSHEAWARRQGGRRAFIVGLPVFALGLVTLVLGVGGWATSAGPDAPAAELSASPAGIDGLPVAWSPRAVTLPPSPSGARPTATPLPSVTPRPTPDPKAPAGVGAGSGRDMPISAEPERLNGYTWPIRRGRITGFFAPRPEGFLVVDGEKIHEGLDIATFCGDPINAAHSGTVLVAGWKAAQAMGFSDSMNPFFARVDRLGIASRLSISIVIDDGNGYRSVYSHLSEAQVRPGDKVKAGDRIGLEGATGNATGCHLHYELIRMDGPWMKVSGDYVRRDLYPPLARSRIDPLRVLSLDVPGAPRFVPGIDPPDR